VAAPAYSIRILFGVVSTTVGASATVPAGYRWVVRDIECITGGTGAVFIGQISGVGEIWVLPIPSGAWSNLTQWHGHVVLNAGETINFSCSSGNGNVTVSGYQLSIQ
jgi:hypothetical protein